MTQAISCSNVHDVCPVHELFWFCLVQVSTTQFCSFQSFHMARVNDGTECARYLRRQPPVRIWVLLTVLFLTLKGQDFAPVRWRRKSLKSTYSYSSSCRTRLGSKIESKRLLRQWPHRRLRLQILFKLLEPCSLETSAASGSSSRDSARSWNVLGQSNGSTATGSLGSHGPGSSDDNWNTRRRLDTFTSPEGEHARSAVLLRFPCEQYHTGITNRINNFWENQTFQSIINPSELLQSRFCVGQTRIRNKSQMLGLCGLIKKIMISPVKLTVPSAEPKQLSRFANPNLLKTGRSESNLRLCGECWPNSSK